MKRKVRVEGWMRRLKRKVGENDWRNNWRRKLEREVIGKDWRGRLKRSFGDGRAVVAIDLFGQTVTLNLLCTARRCGTRCSVWSKHRSLISLARLHYTECESRP